MDQITPTGPLMDQITPTGPLMDQITPTGPLMDQIVLKSQSLLVQDRTVMSACALC